MSRMLTQVQVDNAAWFLDNCVKLYNWDIAKQAGTAEYHREQYYKCISRLWKRLEMNERRKQPRGFVVCA